MAGTREYQLAKVSYLLHLGHPIPAHFRVDAAFHLILGELKSQLADLNAHPTQTLDRILLANTMILPLLYRCECLPLTGGQFRELSLPIERFVLGVPGLPSLIAHKTLHMHLTKGLGLLYLSILQPARVHDSLHSNAQWWNMQTTTCLHVSIFACLPML